MDGVEVITNRRNPNIESGAKELAKERQGNAQAARLHREDFRAYDILLVIKTDTVKNNEEKDEKDTKSKPHSIHRVGLDVILGNCAFGGVRNCASSNTGHIEPFSAEAIENEEGRHDVPP